MSAAPEAFEWLRKRAYTHWALCSPEERERDVFDAWCKDQAYRWKFQTLAAQELSDAQLDVTARGVADWVATHFVPPKRRSQPERTREARTAEAILLGSFYVDELVRSGKRASVRSVANFADASRTSTARAIAWQQGAPKRQKLIDGLSARAWDALTIFDKILPHDGQVVVRLDDLVAGIWSGNSSAALARQHRVRLRAAMVELSSLSIHVCERNGAIAIRRGRRWRSDEASKLVELALQRPGRFCPIPDLPRVTNLFADSQEVRTLTAILMVAVGQEDDDQFCAFLDVTRPLLDPRPVSRAWAVCKAHGEDLVDGLSRRATDVRRPTEQRRGLAEAAHVISMIREDNRWGPAGDRHSELRYPTDQLSREAERRGCPSRRSASELSRRTRQ